MQLLAEKEVNICGMQELAASLAFLARGSDQITLRGDVGAGKTTFARSFVQAISSPDIEITSPTFTLMQSYQVMPTNQPPQTLWHLDLYRLKHTSEAHALGLEELEHAITLVEWPEIIEPLLKQERLDVHIEFTAHETHRHIMLYGNEEWRTRILQVC